MKLFSELIKNLDQSKDKTYQINLIRNYFNSASDSDKLWALFFLAGKKLKKTVDVQSVKTWSIEIAGIEDWLFEESNKLTGDISETAALLITQQHEGTDRNFSHLLDEIEKFQNFKPEKKKEFVLEKWGRLNQIENTVFNKLILGNSLNVVSEPVLLEVLTAFGNDDISILKQRINSDWNPKTISFEDLLNAKNKKNEKVKQLKFPEFKRLKNNLQELGKPTDWIAEIIPDGFNCFIQKEKGDLFVFSENGLNVTHWFPEIQLLVNSISDQSILMAKVISEKNYEKNIRIRSESKTLTKEKLKDNPIQFLIFDALQLNGKNLNSDRLSNRLKLLGKEIEKINRKNLIKESDKIVFKTWIDLKKNLNGSTFLFRKKSGLINEENTGFVFLPEVDLKKINAVLIYAEKEKESFSNLFSVFSFAVKDELNQLVTILKTKINLEENEMKLIQEFIKENTIEKFGPVRTVKPDLIFEISFGGFYESKRHKSGMVLNSPSVTEWKKSASVNQISTLSEIRKSI